MPAPLTQYSYHVMLWEKLLVGSIVYISRVLPVYIRRISGRHDSKLSVDVPVIEHKGILQEAIPYHMGYVIIVIQTHNDLILLPLGIRIAPNVKDRIQFLGDLEGYYNAKGSKDHVSKCLCACTLSQCTITP